MKRLSALPSILLLIFFGTLASPGWSQTEGDFQTKNITGNWSDFTSWNIYNAVDSLWVPSTAALPSNITSVFIQAGHTISVDDANAVCYYLNITGDAASKIAFSSSTAVLNIKGNMGLFSVSHNCFGAWSAGAKIVFSGEDLQGITNLSANSVFINLEVNKPSGTLSSPSALRIDSALYLTAGTLNIPSTSSLLLNGADLIATGGKLTSGSSADLAITGTTGSIVVLPLTANIAFRNITLSGTRILKMDGVNDIKLGAKFIIGDSATYDNGGESRILNNGGPSINISGKFITRSVNGYLGAGAAIPGIDPVLDSASTIEFGRLGDQVVQGSDIYKNITFSGSGTKTPTSSFTPKGTLTITDFAIVDATRSNIGNGLTDTTNLTMNGGRLILGTTGTQPMMDGAYHLTGGVIQFANSGATRQTIRGTKTYHAIEVTGTSVANSSGNIILAPGGSFTVKSGGRFRMNSRQITDSLTVHGTQTIIVEENATFECGSEDGFSGGDGSAGNSTSINSRIETVLLAPGSIVNYLRSGNQVITNQIPYQNLIISGTGNKTAPPAILTVGGNLSKTGTSSFLHDSGTVLLNGASKTFAGLTYNNLILSNGGIKTTSGNSIIIDSLKVAASSTLNLAAGDSVVLHSDAFKTARVGQVEGAITYNVNSKFVVERYISAKRAWRFLSVPVTNSSATYHQAWQENQSQGSVNQTSPSGYGTQITSNILPTVLNGFDYYSANGASVKKYDALSNNWLGINSANDLIQTHDGLMTFVRGDRTAKGISAPPSSTTLRTYGELYTGEIVLPGGADQFTSIGNPFASAIDMRTIDRSNDIDSSIYIWDPNLTGQGFGAYQTFTHIDGEYFPSPGGGSYGAPGSAYNFIASGQAFFVHSKTSGSGGQLIIKEKDKVYSELSRGFRLAGATDVQMLRNNLYALDKDSGVVLVDGVLDILGDNYSNSIDEKDAIKISNFSENLSIKKEEKLLAVEKKHTITGRDTIFYNLANVKLASYRFEVIANLANDGSLRASFEDTWLKSATPVDLNGTTVINFTITTDSGSWNPGRFRIVFNASVAGPLPILFASIKAYQQNKDISLQWKVENEKNSKEYLVEKSVDGRQFNIVTTLKTTGNNSGTNAYQWLDEKAVPGANFYRIKRVDINGETQYSAVVKVVVGKGAPQILVNPNPINGNIINVQFINQPKGDYSLVLFTAGGQRVAESLVIHEEGSSAETLKIEKLLPRGVYLLKVYGKDESVSTVKIFR